MLKNVLSLYLLFDECIAKTGKGACFVYSVSCLVFRFWCFGHVAPGISCFRPIIPAIEIRDTKSNASEIRNTKHDTRQMTLSAQHEDAKASGLALNTKPMLRIYPIASFSAVLLSKAGSVLMSACTSNATSY